MPLLAENKWRPCYVRQWHGYEITQRNTGFHESCEKSLSLLQGRWITNNMGPSRLFLHFKITI